jgi:serine/threonine protein kinase
MSKNETGKEVLVVSKNSNLMDSIEGRDLPFKVCETLKTQRTGKLHVVKKVEYNGKEYCWKHTEFAEKEYQMLTYLHHPQIPKAIKLDKYVLIEWIPGQPLSAGVYTADQHRSILIKLLEVLDYVHSKKVIHLDVKPDNIIVSDNGEVFLIDWEYACHTNSLPDKIHGTPYYIAPEIWYEKNFTTRADIWSLGIMLFEREIGTTPYKGVSTLEELVRFQQTQTFDFGDIEDEKIREMIKQLLSHVKIRPRVHRIFELV